MESGVFLSGFHQIGRHKKRYKKRTVLGVYLLKVLEDVRIYYDGLFHSNLRNEFAALDGVDLGKLILCQQEIKHVQVLDDFLLNVGFGDDQDTTLSVIAQKHLRPGLAIFCADSI